MFNIYLSIFFLNLFADILIRELFTSCADKSNLTEPLYSPHSSNYKWKSNHKHKLVECRCNLEKSNEKFYKKNINQKALMCKFCKFLVKSPRKSLYISIYTTILPFEYKGVVLVMIT